MAHENKDFIAHYGIKGQKWGQRQWQNEDGTYTEAGKERYWGGSQQNSNLVPRQSSVQTSNAVRRGPQMPRTLQQAKPNEQSERRKELYRQKRNKIIAIAAAVAVASIGIHVLTKKRNLNPNQIQKRISEKNLEVMKDQERALRIRNFWERHGLKYR